MGLDFDDDAFVRAPPRFVYRRLVDPASYREWWPGFELLRASPTAATWDAEAVSAGEDLDQLMGAPVEPGEAHFAFRLGRGPLRRRIAIVAHPYRFRPVKGFAVALDGDVVGTIEWWLEPGWGGTVVHHLAHLTRLRRRARVGYRRSARAALFGLKDAVQSEVRTLAGLQP